MSTSDPLSKLYATEQTRLLHVRNAVRREDLSVEAEMPMLCYFKTFEFYRKAKDV